MMTVAQACKNALYEGWYCKVILLQAYDNTVQTVAEGHGTLKDIICMPFILSSYIADASCTRRVPWACSRSCGLRSKHNETYKLCQSLGGGSISSKVQVYISKYLFLTPRGWFGVWDKASSPLAESLRTAKRADMTRSYFFFR
jgi:hypothetical protein